MMLWDLPMAHKNDPLSSYQAGEKHHRSGKAEENRRKILWALASVGAFGPQTARSHRQLASMTGIDYHEVSRRSSELGRSGRCMRVEDDGNIRLWIKKKGVVK